MTISEAMLLKILLRLEREMGDNAEVPERPRRCGVCLHPHDVISLRCDLVKEEKDDGEVVHYHSIALCPKHMEVFANKRNFPTTTAEAIRKVMAHIKCDTTGTWHLPPKDFSD